MSHTYTVSAATTLVSRDKPEMAMVMKRAFRGTPFFVSFVKEAGPILVFDRDHIILDEAYSPEFATDSMAVRMTKFMISAA